MLISHAAKVDEIHPEQPAVVGDSEQIWVAEKRADQQSDGEQIWVVEKRADQQSDGEQIWVAEKRTLEKP